MKTTIFHFSGTGNTLKVARDVAAGLGETELVPMAAAMKGTIDLSADGSGSRFRCIAGGSRLLYGTSSSC